MMRKSNRSNLSFYLRNWTTDTFIVINASNAINGINLIAIANIRSNQKISLKSKINPGKTSSPDML